MCPVCGERVAPKALACRHCGADHATGWNEDATATDGLDLPDDGAFDYDDFVTREFGDGRRAPTGISRVWWIVAVVLLLAFLWMSLS